MGDHLDKPHGSIIIFNESKVVTTLCSAFGKHLILCSCIDPRKFTSPNQNKFNIYTS